MSAYHAHQKLAYGHDREVPTYRHLRKPELPWHTKQQSMWPATWTSRLRSAQVLEGKDWLTRSDHSPVVVSLAG